MPPYAAGRPDAADEKQLAAFAAQIAGLCPAGKVLIVSPDDTCGVGTLKRNKASLQHLYDKGYADGKTISSFISKYGKQS